MTSLETLIDRIQAGAVGRYGDGVVRATPCDAASALDWTNPEIRWVAKTDAFARHRYTELHAYRVVARGKKLVKVAPMYGGSTDAFWVRRPHQATETPRAAILALLERKKGAVRNASERLDEQKRALMTVSVLALSLGVPRAVVDAPPRPREGYDDDVESTPW